MHVHEWQHNTTLNIPVTCLHEPRFLVAWNIHISCNLSYATHQIAMHGIVMHGIASRGHGTCISGMATGAIAMHGTHMGTHVQLRINMHYFVEFSPQL